MAENRRAKSILKALNDIILTPAQLTTTSATPGSFLSVPLITFNLFSNSGTIASGPASVPGWN